MKRFSGKRLWGALVFLALGAGLAACSTQPPMPTVAKVDLPRFMGPWYVIATIPTFLEKDAWNAVETYELAADGAIEDLSSARLRTRHRHECHLGHAVPVALQGRVSHHALG